jgi:DMSO/TMAO reductase YedYZ molybdopterin-dependent catalytic subunit
MTQPASGNDAPVTSDGLIVRAQEPLNLEMPFSSLDGFITPNESFYVRCHFPIPEMAVSGWRLKVEGEVETPFELDYDQLLAMESRTIAATLECAGNNRLFLEPKVKGVQWGLGAVGNANWTGVPLSAVLDRAKVKSGAVEVILEGADEGEIANPPRPNGIIRYARSLPLEKALRDVLLVHTMNGQKLPVSHGFPLRAIVPGWYAMASVKWLHRILVTDQPFAGYYQSIDYTYWKRAAGLPTLAPLAEQQIKAEIAQPENGGTVPAGTTVKVHGAAWSSDADITKVEISVDSGTTWHNTKLLADSVKNAWRLWEYDWRTPATPGKQTLLARATDSRGRVQPFDRDADYGTYVINHVLPIDVEVV